MQNDVPGSGRRIGFDARLWRSQGGERYPHYAKDGTNDSSSGRHVLATAFCVVYAVHVPSMVERHEAEDCNDCEEHGKSRMSDCDMARGEPAEPNSNQAEESHTRSDLLHPQGVSDNSQDERRKPNRHQCYPYERRNVVMRKRDHG